MDRKNVEIECHKKKFCVTHPLTRNSFASMKEKGEKSFEVSIVKETTKIVSCN
jgi:hypothetical protein